MSTRGCRTWLLAAIAITAFSGALLAEYEPPVLLREVQLIPPVEVAGTDLAPEVQVKVVVDPRGRVAEVEVIAIDPSSEHDEAIRRDTIETLMRWRYAPARQDGKPVEARLDWSVQFLPRPKSMEPPKSGTRTLVPWFVEAAEDLEARRARIKRLPLDKRRKVLLSSAETAEKYLIGDQRREFSTPNFVVITDVETKDFAQIVAGNLEATMHFVREVFQEHIQPHPSELKILVYVYSQKDAYKQASLALGSRWFGGGLYRSPGLMLVHTENTQFVSTLIHEACHGYSDHHLERPGAQLPRWLEEGFAEYMGNSQIKKGKLLPGKTIKREYVMTHYGVAKQQTSAAWDLKRIKETLRKGEILTLEEMVTANADLFYGDRQSVYYGMSWLFVHFLRHGGADWADERFPALMLYLAEGYGVKEALEVAYDRGLATFEEPFLEYVARF